LSNQGHRFRCLLRAELDGWRQEGLVDDDTARALTERYALDKLAEQAHSVLMYTIFFVGAALVGCGVVALVAAHWAAIPVWPKVALLMAAMLAAHLGGYYLWHVRVPARPHLGHALTLLGTLIFGANIGLFAQIFHISERFYDGFMAWALGAAIMAYVLRSVPHATVAVIASWVWFGGFVGANETPLLVYPVVAAAALLPLCYWKRSHWLFLLTLLAVAGSLMTNAMVFGESTRDGMLAFVLPATALWCYGALHRREGRWPGFGAMARSLGALGLAGLVYVFSFQDMAKELLRDSWVLQYAYDIRCVLALGMTVAAVLGAATAALLRRVTILAPAAATVAILGAMMLPAPVVWPTVAFNLIAVALAGHGIWRGARYYERRPYWAGLGLLVLLIVSRFFEYESHLMIKAVGFVAAGAVLIYAGIKFETRLRARSGETHDA